MMDIVERLKKMVGRGDYYDDEYQAAIAEIERLRRRVEVLEMDYSHSIKEAIDLGNGWKEACDEIERMREHIANYKKLWETSNALDQQISEDWSAECKRLRGALKEISEMQEYDSYHYKEVARKTLGEKE
jgi:uncharacterized protein YdcH (DUF465 family)